MTAVVSQVDISALPFHPHLANVQTLPSILLCFCLLATLPLLQQQFCSFHDSVSAKQFCRLRPVAQKCSLVLKWQHRHEHAPLADQPLRAIQVPHLSGFEASKQSIKNRGLLQSIRLFLAGLHDRARALANMPAAYLKVAGTPGSNSFMELSEEDLQQYFEKHPSKYAVSQT